MSENPNIEQKKSQIRKSATPFFNYLFNYLLLSTLTATVTTSDTANAKAAMVINKKLVSKVTIINSFL